MGNRTVTIEGGIEPGEKRIVEVDDTEVGVFNVDGELYAYENRCHNQGGPVCEGQVGGTVTASYDPDAGETVTEWVKEGRILTCPWCGMEYDLVTGAAEVKSGVELTAFEVRAEDDGIVISGS